MSENTYRLYKALLLTVLVVGSLVIAFRVGNAASRAVLTAADAASRQAENGRWVQTAVTRSTQNPDGSWTGLRIAFDTRTGQTN